MILEKWKVCLFVWTVWNDKWMKCEMLISITFACCWWNSQPITWSYWIEIIQSPKISIVAFVVLPYSTLISCCVCPKAPGDYWCCLKVLRNRYGRVHQVQGNRTFKVQFHPRLQYCYGSIFHISKLGWMGNGSSFHHRWNHALWS